MRTRLSVPLCVAVAAVTLAAQGDQQPVFRAGANYVRVDMYALRDGEPVLDLRADEVEVLEDGVPQKVENFERILVRAPGALSVPVEPDGLAASREAAGDPRARVFVLFLDTYHTQLDGSANVRRPLVRFIERILGPDDLVALMTPEMSASAITLGRKTAVIANILDEEWWGRRQRLADNDPKDDLYDQCGSIANMAPALVEELKARRREKLTFDAFEDLVTHLDTLREERKAVVVVTEGWLLYEPNSQLERIDPQRGPAPPPALRPPIGPPTEQGMVNQPMLVECEADRLALARVDHDRRLRDIGEAANRSNVTFYPVFARGLATFDAPISPDSEKTFTPTAANAGNLLTRQTSLRNLAHDTDGEAIINTNNIDGALQRIVDDLSSYYLLGYYSTNSKLDGRFREITVRVKRPGVRVRARRGYRGRTAEELVAAASAPTDPARAAVASALNSVAGLNARTMFRVRPSTWARQDGASTAAVVWLVGELDYRVRKELAWTAGSEAEVVVLGADGEEVHSRTVTVAPGDGSFGLRIPERGTLAPGDYAVRVRLRPESGSDLVMSDTVRVVVPGRAAALGEAVLWRRGPSTGPRYLRTADPRFQRSDRLRLEMATSLEGEAAGRMLDRAGSLLPVPVQLTRRVDADSNIAWVVADATLAPLAPGDYAIEVTLGAETQVTGFRIVP